MKILFLSQVFPYPPDRGDRLKVFNLVKYLGQQNTVHLVSFYEPGDDLETGKAVLKPYYASIDLYPIREGGLHGLRTPSYFWGARPFFLRRYRGTALDRDLLQLAAKYHPDVCHFDLLGMAAFQSALQSYPEVMGCYDALHIAVARDAQAERKPLRRLYLRHQARVLRRYEQTVLPIFDRCIFAGPEDYVRMKTLAPALRATVIPNGIDADYVRPLGLPEEHHSLVFSGYMGGGQSIDAVEFFCAGILPRIRQEIPDVRFVVAGRDPAPRIRELGAQQGFTVTGAVPDMRPYLDRASLYVCPVRGGTGFKNRLAEAMAMGKAIVATRLSAAGLEDAQDGRHLVLADEPDQFARQVIRLLHDTDRRRRFGTEARLLIERSYRWEQVARRFEDLYKEAIAERRSMAPLRSMP